MSRATNGPEAFARKVIEFTDRANSDGPRLSAFRVGGPTSAEIRLPAGIDAFLLTRRDALQAFAVYTSLAAVSALTTLCCESTGKGGIHTKEQSTALRLNLGDVASGDRGIDMAHRMSEPPDSGAPQQLAAVKAKPIWRL